MGVELPRKESMHVLAEVEADAVRAACAIARTANEAAHMLGISRWALKRRIARHNIIFKKGKGGKPSV